MSGAPKEVLPDSLFVDLIQTERGRGVAGESVSHTEPAAGGWQGARSPKHPPHQPSPPGLTSTVSGRPTSKDEFQKKAVLFLKENEKTVVLNFQDEHAAR